LIIPATCSVFVSFSGFMVGPVNSIENSIIRDATPN
jgi:hypothetical protein